ncbi:MAG: sulfite exporter TauE/SafE family protein [Chloroflexota bacterium]
MNPLLAVIIVIFLAIVIKGIIGFGEALIAMPLLTLAVGLQTAAPLVGLMGTLITAIVAIEQWREVDFSATWRLVLGSALGIPVGLILLKLVPAPWMMHGMGILLVIYAAYTLIAPHWEGLSHPAWVYIFGFFAGMLGSAYNTSGPPVVIYASARRWSPEQFRATLQGCFLPMSLMVIFSHAVSGLWTPTVLVMFLLILPIILVAYWAGTYASRYIPADQFARLVRVGLGILGVMLVIR